MDSPASKAFADRLAKYAFDPKPASPARTRSARAAAGPIAGPSTPTARKSSPVSARSTGKRKRVIKDDGEILATDEESASGTTSRGGLVTAASPTPGKTTPKSGKKPRPFAGPEVYAHLKPVTDHLRPDLDSESTCEIHAKLYRSSKSSFVGSSGSELRLTIVLAEVLTPSISPGEPDRFRSRSISHPGKMSSTLGHHFAHPTNKFWVRRACTEVSRTISG